MTLSAKVVWCHLLTGDGLAQQKQSHLSWQGHPKGRGQLALGRRPMHKSKRCMLQITLGLYKRNIVLK